MNLQQFLNPINTFLGGISPIATYPTLATPNDLQLEQEQLQRQFNQLRHIPHEIQNIENVLSQSISPISDDMLQLEGIDLDFDNSFNSGLNDLGSTVDNITKYPYEYEHFMSTQYVDGLDNPEKKEISKSIDSYINDPKLLAEFFNQTQFSFY